MKWKRYKNFLEDFFINDFGCIAFNPVTQSINLIDALSFVQKIYLKNNVEQERITWTTLASLIYLRKEGLIDITVWCAKGEDCDNETLFFTDEEDLEAVANSSRMVLCVKDHIVYTVAASLTKKGEEWYSELKDKYPILFKECYSNKIANIYEHYYNEIHSPEGFDKEIEVPDSIRLKSYNI